MFGIILSLISAIGYSLNQIFNKKLILNRLNNYEALFISNIFLLFFNFLIMVSFSRKIIFSEITKIITSNFIYYYMLNGLIGFFALFFLFKSFKRLKVGESLTIANIYPFVTLFLTFFFFGEKITLFQLIIMLIIFVSIFFLIIDDSKFKLSIYDFYPLLTAIGWGTYGFLIYYYLKNNLDLYISLFLIQLFMFLFSLVFFLYYKSKNIKKILINKKNILFGFLAGFFSFIGTLFYSLGTFYLNPAIVSSIGSAQVPLSFLFSYFILSEKINKKQIILILFITSCLFLFNFKF
jgi:drug/metabolite transporter (DMT)-like permease